MPPSGGPHHIHLPPLHIFVTAHRVLHLLRRSLALTCRALEVQEVRLRALRLVSAAPCKQFQGNLHGLIEKLHIFLFPCSSSARPEKFAQTFPITYLAKPSGFDLLIAVGNGKCPPVSLPYACLTYLFGIMLRLIFLKYCFLPYHAV